MRRTPLALMLLLPAVVLADPYYFKTKSPEILLNAMTPMKVTARQVEANVCEKCVDGRVTPLGGRYVFELSAATKAYETGGGKPVPTSLPKLLARNKGNYVFHCVPHGKGRYRVIAVYW